MKKIVSLLFFMLCSSASYSEIRYNIVDLGFIGSKSEAYSVNNSGQIVGYAYTNGVQHAMLFDSSDKQKHRDLGGTCAYSINSSGKIVGYSIFGTSGYATLFGTTTTENKILGSQPSNTYSSVAFSINDNGQIVGFEYFDNSRATIFDPTGERNNIQIGKTAVSEAYCINNSGTIVGLDYHAVIFDKSPQHNSLNLDGTPNYQYGAALYVNNNGVVVGKLNNRAMLFDATGGGSNIDLGILPDYYWSQARSVNNNGQIVGYSYTDYLYRATLFDSSGHGNNIDLNTLIDQNSGWTLLKANGINDNGWIVGAGLSIDGKQHAFLLTPIPEPATLLLLGLGGMTLRKRK